MQIQYENMIKKIRLIKTMMYIFIFGGLKTNSNISPHGNSGKNPISLQKSEILRKFNILTFNIVKKLVSFRKSSLLC